MELKKKILTPAPKSLKLPSFQIVYIFVFHSRLFFLAF